MTSRRIALDAEPVEFLLDLATCLLLNCASVDRRFGGTISFGEGLDESSDRLAACREPGRPDRFQDHTSASMLHVSINRAHMDFLAIRPPGEEPGRQLRQDDVFGHRVDHPMSGPPGLSPGSNAVHAALAG